MKGGVELLEIRPDQLCSNDLGGEQVIMICLIFLLLDFILIDKGKLL